MQSKQNLQDLFLLRAKRDRVPVTMFLMNVSDAGNHHRL